MDQRRTEELVSCILGALYHRICKIVQYGSASDCRETDIAILTPYKISTDEEARLSKAVADFNKKHKEAVSVIDIDYPSFLKRKDSTPLYQEIDRSGSLLWSEDNNAG